MLIKDVMTPNPVTVAFDAQVRDVARLLKKYRIGGLPVMDGERIIGIVTETDVLSLLDTSESSDDICLPLPLDAI
ncbi:MAG: CBS domain-containing protein, partial [Methanomicrobium sp.]|nr:CBS domain-containing protein [Methanomicrobium sp.]